MRIETNAIDKFERIILSKKFGANSFMDAPKKIIGMVPIKIDLNKLSCNKYLKFFLKYCFLKLKTSSLKYQSNAKTLPNWIIADKDGPGSSIPKKREITFRWAVLLTGINSVKPCINPYKINFKYSKDFK